MEFEKRSGWHGPVFCETMKDEDGNPTHLRLSVGVLLIPDDELDIIKTKMMDAMINGITSVLEEEGVIDV